jgi:hypothetical protein
MNLTSYPHLNFTCDSCQAEYRQTTAYSPARNLTQLSYQPTYCSNCVIITEEPEVDQRITGRTKQLNLKVKEQTHYLLKEISRQEKKLMTEILEKALECYDKHHAKTNS